MRAENFDYAWYLELGVDADCIGLCRRGLSLTLGLSKGTYLHKEK